jgi:hypothetical protein
MSNPYLLYKRLEVIHKKIEARKTTILEADLAVVKARLGFQQWEIENVKEMNKAELKFLYHEKKLIEEQIVASCLVNLAKAEAAAGAEAAAAADGASDAKRARKK